MELTINYLLAVCFFSAKQATYHTYLVEICNLCYYLVVIKIKMEMKPILIIVGVLAAVALVLFLAINVVPKALVSLTKASGSGSVSVTNSYVLGQKLLAEADGEDTCIVNVFLLDKNGRGVSGKTVELTGMDNISKVNNVTDDKGKITFAMTSTTDGQFKLTAEYNGLELPKVVMVTFRK